MLYLVSCVSQKLAAPAPARELYASQWFRLARAYVEAQGQPWGILSALHGLVMPEQVIAPYNARLHDLDRVHRREWANRVAQAVYYRLDIPRPGPIVVLAGRVYREPLARELADWFGYRVEAPLAGLGIGRQLQWFSQRISK